MRAYGSELEFPVGLIWALPPSLEGEGERFDPKQPRTTMAWPSGYAAKTEFNMDNFGNLKNGRDNHLVSIGELRQQNRRFAHVFATKRAQPGGTEQREDYEIMDRVLVGASTVPYNEVIVNVGGNEAQDSGNVTGKPKPKPTLRSGLGRPLALFCRNCTYLSLCSLLRARMRLTKVRMDGNEGNSAVLTISRRRGSEGTFTYPTNAIQFDPYLTYLLTG